MSDSSSLRMGEYGLYIIDLAQGHLSTTSRRRALSARPRGRTPAMMGEIRSAIVSESREFNPSSSGFISTAKG